jgi:Zn ribbon nucleic-acid-binding protein
MLGNEMSDALWERLHERMSGDTCPGCRQTLDRRHIELQPVENRVRVKCLRCGYTYLDSGSGILLDVNDSDDSHEFDQS